MQFFDKNSRFICCVADLRDYPEFAIDSHNVSYIDGFFSNEELAVCHRITDQRYFHQWRIGRYLVKRLMFEPKEDVNPEPDHRFQEVTICSRDERNRGIPPQVLVAKTRQLKTSEFFSIAHAGNAVAVVRSHRAERIGVDLVEFGSVTTGMLQIFFTQRERLIVRKLSDGDGQHCADKIWGIKESVYKAICRDEPFMPLSIEVGMIRHLSYNSESPFVGDDSGFSIETPPGKIAEPVIFPFKSSWVVVALTNKIDSEMETRL